MRRLSLTSTLFGVDPRNIGTKKPQVFELAAFKVAGWTRLELATSCVTGRRSNQLNYHPSGLKYYAL